MQQIHGGHGFLLPSLGTLSDRVYMAGYLPSSFSESHMPWPKLEKSAVRYLAVGVFNTVFGLSLIYGAKWFLHFSDVVANMTGYAIGIVVSFILNSRWTFNHDGAWLPAFARFLLVLFIAYLANLGTVVIALSVGVNAYLAHLIGVPVYTVIGYLGGRFFAFKPTLDIAPDTTPDLSKP
ncbi:MAG: GtrA family protein [Gammaproteobacteria bacterium]|nr:GtrA family protein [Gammaproteobacteria bacterium]